MNNDDNKPVPEKTREDELREWNESQSNSMLKAKPGSNKAAGVAVALTAVALCGFVYWLKHSDEPVAGNSVGNDAITAAQPRRVQDPTLKRQAAQVAPVSNDGSTAPADTPRTVVDRQNQTGMSEAEKRRQAIELQRELEEQKMQAARQRSAIIATAKDEGFTDEAEGQKGGSGSLGVGSDRNAPVPSNANSAYASSTFTDGVTVSKVRKMENLEYKVLQGAVIEAVLQPRAQSQLPGQICVDIQQDVYAAVGRRVLIPWGSTVCGSYNASLRPGQERLFTIWNWLRTPNLPGRPAMEIAINSAGSDQLGTAGQGGVVDNHWGQIFGVAAAVSIIGAGASNTGVSSGDQENSASRYRTEVQQAASESAQTILGRYASIQPTLTVPHGSRVVIYLQRDLDFTSQFEAEIEHAKSGGVTFIQ